MPSHGMTITNSTHSVFATPPMSLLRKMSPRIHHRHMNQAKNRKNSSSTSRNDPLLLNIEGLSLRTVRDGPLRGQRWKHDGSPRPGRLGDPVSSAELSTQR